MLVLSLALFSVVLSFADVQEVSPDNLDNLLEIGPSLILFYNGADKASEQLRNTFRQTEPRFNGYGLTIGEFDCSKYPDKCKNPRIKQVPSIACSQHPDTHSLLGEKTETEIATFVNLEMRKTIRHFTRREDADRAFQGFDRAVIGYFPDSNSPEYETFMKAAPNIRDGDVWVAVVNSNIPKVCIEHVDLKLNVVREYNGTLAPSPEVSQSWRIYHFIMFVTRCVSPVVEEVNGNTNRRYFESEGPVCFVFVDSGRVQYDVKEHGVSYNDPQVMLKAIAPVAQTFEDRMQFCVIDYQQYWRYAHTVGLTGKVFPSFVIVSPFEHALMPGAKAHYTFHCSVPSERANDVETGTLSAPLEINEVQVWCSEFLSGKVPLALRSEPIPPSQPETVIELVGDTFNRTVFESNKYVFVTFYAPWCERCKELHPVFAAIAEELKNDSRIIMARIDTTKNDVYPGIVVDGYPTLLLFLPNQPDNILHCYDFYDDSLIRRFLHDNIPDLKLDLKLSPEEEDRFRHGKDFDRLADRKEEL